MFDIKAPEERRKVIASMTHEEMIACVLTEFAPKFAADRLQVVNSWFISLPTLLGKQRFGAQTTRRI
jgi:hypothetical protein